MIHIKEVARKDPDPIEVFYSYAQTPKDEALLKELEKHLGPLIRGHLIKGWHRRDIQIGTDWKQAADYHLNIAHLILLLISPDFMNSEYCYSVEMQRALERYEKGEVRIIPILLRPVNLKGTQIEPLCALPANGKAITRWTDRDEAFANVSKDIQKVIEEVIAASARNDQSLTSDFDGYWHPQDSDMHSPAIPMETVSRVSILPEETCRKCGGSSLEISEGTGCDLVICSRNDRDPASIASGAAQKQWRRCPSCQNQVEVRCMFCTECGARMEKYHAFPFNVFAMFPQHELSRSLREMYFDLGFALLRGQKYDHAIAAFKHALDEKGIKPEKNEIMLYLAYGHEMCGDRTEAFRDYLQAVLQAPPYISTVLSHVYDILPQKIDWKEVREWLTFRLN